MQKITKTHLQVLSVNRYVVYYFVGKFTNVLTFVKGVRTLIFLAYLLSPCIVPTFRQVRKGIKVGFGFKLPYREDVPRKTTAAKFKCPVSEN